VFFSHGSLQNQAAGSQDADILRLQAQQLRQENDQLKVCCARACRPMCLHLAIYSLAQAASDAEAQRFEAEAQRFEAEAQRFEAENQRVEAEAQQFEAEAQRFEAEARRFEAENQSLREEIHRLMLAASSPSAASSTTS
jgi:hypothetical protein